MSVVSPRLTNRKHMKGGRSQTKRRSLLQKTHSLEPRDSSQKLHRTDRRADLLLRREG